MKKKVFKGLLVAGLLVVAGTVFALSGLLPKQKESKKSVEVKKQQYIDSSRSNTFSTMLKNPEFAKKVKKELYKKLGWEIGKFRSKKEKKYTEILLKEKNEKYRRNAEFDLRYELTKKGNENALRPLVEGLLDSYTSKIMRRGFINKLGSLGDKKAIPVLLKFVNDNDILVGEIVGNALYRLGEKKIAYQIYETFVKKGVIIPNGLYRFQGDYEAKEMLFRILKYDNNPVMQALALYHLSTIVKSELIYKDYIELKQKLTKGTIDFQDRKYKSRMSRYLRWTAKNMGIKNEK